MTDQAAITQHIISLEKAALDKYFAGDMSGYLELWSKDNFSYFDANCVERADSYQQVADFLQEKVAGRMHADRYDFHNPRVQLGQDMAVLTYQLHADTTMIEMHYNVIEVFQKEHGEWHVIHSTWDLITPFSPDVKRPKTNVLV